ncbi:hypothetical protein HN803_02950 [candidate division WWE3 bacterium]|jgi:hypothetical protein|nr:hypothetical protein [candidate division WWE3 bacterium]
MAKMNLTPEEIEIISEMRRIADEKKAQEAALITPEDEDEIGKIIDDAIGEAKLEKASLSDRVTRMEAMFTQILAIKQELDNMFQQFLTKKEDDVKQNEQRSKQNIQILKEIHDLRVHVDKLKPKIGLMFYGISIAAGLTASYVLPEIVPFLEKVFGIANAVKG